MIVNGVGASDALGLLRCPGCKAPFVPAPGESKCIACRIAARRRRASGERGKAIVEREFQLIFIAKHANYATATQPTEADLARGRTRRRIEDIEDDRRVRLECGYCD